jgi:hypothetical protein
MVDNFDDEVFRWDFDHAPDAATFLADDTNKLSAFSVVPPGEYQWMPRDENEVDEGEPTLSLDGYTDEVGNDIVSGWFFPGRTPRQLDWLFTNRFDGGEKSAPATIGKYDQTRGAWRVYIGVATWATDNSINNRYRDLTITFTELEVLA